MLFWIYDSEVQTGWYITMESYSEHCSDHWLRRILTRLPSLGTLLKEHFQLIYFRTLSRCYLQHVTCCMCKRVQSSFLFEKRVSGKEKYQNKKNHKFLIPATIGCLFSIFHHYLDRIFYFILDWFVTKLCFRLFNTAIMMIRNLDHFISCYNWISSNQIVQNF